MPLSWKRADGGFEDEGPGSKIEGQTGVVSVCMVVRMDDWCFPVTDAKNETEDEKEL